MSQITKKALTKALGELLSIKPLSKITISDITDRAGVNRHTFYYHFKDINDMIAWSFTSTIKELLDKEISYSNWQKTFSVLLRACTNRRKDVLTIYHSDAKDYILRLFNEWIYTLLRRVIDEQSIGMHILDSDKEYIAHFYQYGFVGLLLHWLDSGMMEDADYMLERLGILVQGDLKDSLKRFDSNFKDISK